MMKDTYLSKAPKQLSVAERRLMKRSTGSPRAPKRLSGVEDPNGAERAMAALVAEAEDVLSQKAKDQRSRINAQKRDQHIAYTRIIIKAKQDARSTNLTSFVCLLLAIVLWMLTSWISHFLPGNTVPDVIRLLPLLVIGIWGILFFDHLRHLRSIAARKPAE